MNLEKKINPLLDDNDLVSLSYIFSEIMEKTVKTMQVSYFCKAKFFSSLGVSVYTSLLNGQLLLIYPNLKVTESVSVYIRESH